MQRFAALTGLRFFAAMTIVFWHSQTGYFFEFGAFSPFYLAGAVPIFFVLSGFVLTIGADRYRTWGEFFVARVARIWPAHIAALMFLIGCFYPYSLEFFQHADTQWRLFLNVMLLQAWSPNQLTYWSYNAPSWSVSSELFFYAAFPLAFAYLRRHTLARTALIVSSIFGAIMAIDVLWPGIDANWLSSVNPVSCFAAFAIGIATGIWLKKLPVPRGNGAIIQFVAVASALGANALFATYTAPLPAAATQFIFVFGPTPFYAVMILSLARYDGPISRAMSWRPIVYGGEISYSIYLFHQIIIRWHSVELAAFSSVPIWIQYTAILAATFAVAVACHHLVEIPARRWIIDGWRKLSYGVAASH